MLCAALNNKRLCEQCAANHAKKLIANAFNSGQLCTLPQTQPHRRQMLETVQQTNECSVDLLAGTYQHAHCKLLLQANRENETSTKDWTVQQRTFATLHASKFGLWYHSQQKLLRANRGLCLYDSKSILTHVMRSDPCGVEIDEIVIQYTDAYKDVHKLLSTGKLNEYDGKVWVRPSR